MFLFTSRQTEGGRQILSRPPSPEGEMHARFGTDPSTNYSMHERSYIQCEYRKFLLKKKKVSIVDGIFR